MPCSQPTWVPVAPSAWRRKSLQQHARLGFGRELAAVERQPDAHALVFVHAAHRRASSITRGAELAEHIAPHRRRGVQVVIAFEFLRPFADRRSRIAVDRTHHRPPGHAADAEARRAALRPRWPPPR